MPDTFTEVTTQSWWSRLGESIKAVLVGLVMFVASFPLLFWNEGRAVQTAKSQKEGAAAVIDVGTDKVDKANEGKLIHVVGTPTADETLSDDDFGMSGKGIELRRTVEMYQWQETRSSETKKKLGGGTETVTTYKYDTGWAENRQDSSAFKQKDGHENPPLPFASKTVAAKTVTLGAFQVPPNLAAKMGAPEAIAVDDKTIAALPGDLKTRARAAEGAVYVGPDPAHPKVGDVRVKFTVLKPAESTVIAAQVGNGFAPYQTKAGDKLQMVEPGKHTAAEMFKQAAATNKALTWFLRGLGWFIMFIGVMLVFRPLVTVADVVPFIGSVLGFGAGVFAFFVAVIFSSITIAIAWIVYRPLIGILLLVVAGGGIFGLTMLKKRRAAPAAAAPG